MTSYMEKGDYAFLQAAGDGGFRTLLRKRSDSRLKDSGSCTDVRATSIGDEQRRMYIIDLIGAAPAAGGSLGKYIPIEVIIDILVAERTKEMSKMSRIIAEYEKLYGELDTISDYNHGYSSSVSRRQARPRSGATSRTRPGSTRSGTSVSFSSSGHYTTVQVDMYEERPVWHSDDMDNVDADALRRQITSLSQELQSQRALSQAAVNMLESLKDIVDRTDEEMKQLMPAQGQDDTSLEPCTVSNIAEIQDALALLSASQLPSLNQDPAVVARKLGDLKQCVEKLKNVAQENARLKRENNFIRGQLLNLPVDENEIVSQYAPMRKKITQSIDELNNLKQTLSSAKEAGSKDLVLWREHSRKLDEVLEERDALKHRMSKLADLEDQVQRLRERSARADELEIENCDLRYQIHELEKYRRISNVQEEHLENLKKEKNLTAESMESMRAERDNLARKLTDKAAVEESLKQLTEKHRLCACVKQERDSLKAKLVKYGNVDEELKMLRKQAADFRSVQMERDRLLEQVQELSTLQAQVLENSDCSSECAFWKEQFSMMRVQRNSLKRQLADRQCMISDQEDEIKALIGHVDCCSLKNKTLKEEIKKCFELMKTELTRKDAMLKDSKIKLADLEKENRSTTEMERYYNDIISALKKQLAEKQSIINVLQSKLETNVIEASSELVKRMSTELEKGRKDNEKAEELIKEIKQKCLCKNQLKLIEETKRSLAETLKHIEDKKKAPE